MTEHERNDATDVDVALRAAIHDSVSDVHPSRGLDEIQARTGRRGRRTWAWGALAAVAATAATVVAVTVVTDDAPQGAAGTPAASQTPDLPSSPTPTEPTPSEEPTPDSGTGDLSPLPVYFVGDTPSGPRLFREFAPGTGTVDSARLLDALELAMRGEAQDPDYGSGWPGGGSPDGFNVVGAGFASTGDFLDTIRIAIDSEDDITARPAGLSDAEARLALQQLVYTAQAVLQERFPVEFTGVNGVPLRRLLGVDVSQPVTNEPEMQVQAPVWIITPQEGAVVGHTFTVEGRGAFFEANVSWQLLDGERVVKEGFTTAQECCTLAPFSFEVRDVIEGIYTLRVYDADVSGGEGSGGEQQDTKQITVSK